MFGKTDYDKISLDDFSDDDSSGDERGTHPTAGGARNRSTPNSTGNGSSNYGDDGNGGSQLRQQQLMKAQDQGLEMLGKAAERLGTLSMGISEELGQQNKYLDEMDEDLEVAADDLDFVTRKTKEFIAKSGGQKTCLVIVALAAIVILLILLILYT
jgi:hypothetical protein